MWGFAFSADGKVLTASGQRWDVATGREFAPVPQDEDSRLSLFTFSPDGRTAVATDLRREALLLIDPTTGRPLHEIRLFENQRRHRIHSEGVVFSRDGKLLAVAAAEERFERPRLGEPEAPLPDTIHLFDVTTGRKVRSLRPGRDVPQNFVFSPDGTMLVVPEDHWNITQFWDVATGKLIRELPEHLDQRRHWRDISSVACSPDGRFIALDALGNTVVILETATGKPIRTLVGHTARVKALAFSPDGLHVVSGTADSAAIVWPVFPTGKDTVRPDKWDATTGEKLWKSLAAEPTEAYPAVASLLAAPKQAALMLKERLKPEPEFDPKEVARLIAALGSPTEAERDAAVSAIRRFGSAVEPLLYKAARSDDPDFNRRVRRVLRAMASPDPDLEEVRGLRAISTLERIATTEAETVLETLARGRDDGPHTRAAQAALLRLEERHRFAVPPAVAPPTPKPQGAELKTLYAHKKQLLALAFTPDGKTALSAALDGKVRRWDLVAGKELPALPEHPDGAFAVAVSLDGKRIVTTGADGKVRLSDANGREEHVFKEHNGPVYAAAFSVDGRFIAAGGQDGTAKVWDTTTGELKRTITVFTRRADEAEAKAGGVTGVAFTPDGKGLVTTAILPHGNSFNGRFIPSYRADQVRVWSVEDGSKVRTLGGNGNALAASGGRFLVTGVSGGAMVINNDNEGPITLFTGEVAVVDGKTGRVLRSLGGGTGALSLDGRLIATGMGSPVHLGGVLRPSRDRTEDSQRLRLWEAETGAELLRFGGEPPVVVTFSPDGRHVLFGTGDGDVKLADTLPPKVTPPVDRMGLDAAWTALASEDAATAYQAVVALAGSKDSAQFLKAKLHPAPPDDAAIVKLIAELDAPRYVLRRAAILELERRGAEAVPALSVASTRSIPIKVKQQIEALLAAPSARKFPDPLRRGRAVWALERLGTPEAKAVILTIPTSE